MGLTLVLGVLPPLRVLWTLNVLIDLTFAGYVGLLLQRRSLTLQADRTVRYLPTPMTARSRAQAGAVTDEIDLREYVSF